MIYMAGPKYKPIKMVVSFIYLFKSRRSAGIYLFIHGLATFRHSFFSFFNFSFFRNAGISHLFIQKLVDFLTFIFSYFSFFHSSGTRKSLIYLFKNQSISRHSFFHFFIQPWQKTLILSFRMRRLGGP